MKPGPQPTGCQAITISLPAESAAYLRRRGGPRGQGALIHQLIERRRAQERRRTIRTNPDLWEQAEVRCAQTGETLSEYVSALLRADLNSEGPAIAAPALQVSSNGGSTCQS